MHVTARKALQRHQSQETTAPVVESGADTVMRPPDRAGAEAHLLESLVGTEPSPELAAQVVAEQKRGLELLDDESLRQLAVLKLGCLSNEEIGRRLGCARHLVTLKLGLIRKKWLRELAA
jgi:hypothetical protein